MTYKVHTIIACILQIKELKSRLIKEPAQIIELASGNPAYSYTKAHALRYFITASHCLRYYTTSTELAASWGAWLLVVLLIPEQRL